MNGALDITEDWSELYTVIPEAGTVPADDAVEVRSTLLESRMRDEERVRFGEIETLTEKLHFGGVLWVGLEQVVIVHLEFDLSPVRMLQAAAGAPIRLSQIG